MITNIFVFKQKKFLENIKDNAIEIIIEPFYSGESLLSDIQKGQSYDLIFLDIELNTTTGIIVANAIRRDYENYISKIIFMTSRDGYQDQLFDIQTFGYIKKPIDKDKVVGYINLFKKISKKENNVFRYKFGRDIRSAEYQNIMYFENRLKKIKIVTKDGEDEFYDTIKNIINRLPDNFIKIHGSFVVNYEYVINVMADSVLLTNGDIIPVSKSNMRQLYKLQMQFIKEIRDADF